MDDDLATHVLAFVKEMLTDESRGTRVAPAVPVPDDAPVTDRLVAFMGRRP